MTASCSVLENILSCDIGSIWCAIPPSVAYPTIENNFTSPNYHLFTVNNIGPRLDNYTIAYKSSE